MGQVVAALLAAALLLAGVAGCGGDGAEPGAPKGAALVLDFTPNAVHAGIYAAQDLGFFKEEGADLEIREPGSSSDAPKLLAAGRADFAILDIHDLGIAAERGFAVVGVLPIVQRPLASVIARAGGPVRRPRGLEGRTVGVTGLPSDDAVVDSEVAADGGYPALVKRVTIGFNAVASLAARRVDAVAGFWNSEGVALRRRGIPTRIFKVDRFGAPPYPELVLATSRRTLREDPELVAAVRKGTARGYRFTVQHPTQALDCVVEAVPDLNRNAQQAQLRTLLPILNPAPFDRRVLRAWAAWDVEHDILNRPPNINTLFPSG